MTRRPKLSVRLHGGMTPAHCVAIALAAEAAGLNGLWFAENAFGRGILPSAAACAIATSRIHIGAGVFNPYSRHPTMMAMEIAALDELSGGRASISVGSGIGSAVNKIGHSAEKPLPALRDTLTILRGLLNGESVDHAGRAFCAHGVKLDNAPREGIAIYLAGRGDLTVKLSGAAADGLIISNMCSLAYSRRAAEISGRSRAAAGRSAPFKIVQYMPCAVDADRSRAIETAKRAVGRMLPNYWSLAEKIVSARTGLVTGTGIGEQDFIIAARRLRSGEDPCSVLDERFTRAFSIAGTPEECVADAAQFAQAGVSELALTFEGPDARGAMAMLGEAMQKEPGD